MTDDWQVGDLAMLVRSKEYPGKWICPAAKTVPSGAIFTVVSVIRTPEWVALGLDELKSSWRNGEWNARAFRKIRPLSDEERASFLADLREPVRQPA